MSISLREYRNYWKSCQISD